MAEVAEESLFFSEDLDKHDDKEGGPDGQSFPSPEPDHGTGKVGEGAGEHGIAVEAVWPVGHEMLCARRYFMAEGVHRVAFAMCLHINNCPYT